MTTLRRRILPALAAAALVGAAAAPAYAAPAPSPTPTASTPTSSTTTPATPGITRLQVPAAARTAVDGREVVAALRPQQTKGFSTLGVTWAAGPAQPTVQVRTLTGGTWSAWSTLGHQELASDDERARPGTAATYTGDSTGVEVRVLVDTGAPAPSDLQLTLVDPRHLASDAAPATTRPEASGRAGTLQPPMPSVVSRAAWGADESLKAKAGASCMEPKIDSTIKAVVIHHTEGSNDYTADQSAAIVRGIYAYHVTGNGWCDIGYNFLVDRYGKIFEGRFGGMTKPVHGAHAYEWNTNTMGVSVMGSFTSQLPPEAALDATVRLTAWRLAAYYRQPTGQLTIGSQTSDVISGHRQVVSTDCPGEALYAYLPTLRNRVSTLMGSFQTPIWQKWQALGGAAGQAGQPFIGEAPYAGGRVTRFANMDIYQRPDGTVRWTRGAIRDKYAAVGDAASRLGFPTTDEICSSTGCYQGFDGGVIIWSPQAGAHPNWGAIRDKYGQLGFEQGQLGYPTTDEICSSTGCYQGFAKGFLLWSPATGAHVNRGALRDKFAEQGYERGWLGYPTTDDACDAGGCWQDYQGGSLTTNRDRGTHFTRGAIRERYLALGGRGGAFGYPSSDEICGLRDGGCVQLFADRAIYWSPRSGVWENVGEIRKAYASQGYENGRLGYPTSGERCDRVGCVQSFQGGTITYRWGGTAVIS